MDMLHIRLFGGFHLSRSDDRLGDTPLTRGLQSFLAYLLLHRQRVFSRDVLAGLFWGEKSDERARNCLSTALWRLRQALEPAAVPKGTYLITNANSEVGFNPFSNHWLDVGMFEQIASEVLAKPVSAMGEDDALKLETGAALYTGDLLEGFYDEWVLQERERFRSLYMESLAHLMHYHKERGNSEKGVNCARKILSQEPLREEIHRELMRIYWDSGQRTKAIQQYQTCGKVLERELDILPMEETQALYATILKANRLQGELAIRQTRQRETPRERITLSHAVDQLQNAIMKLQETSDQLHHAIRLLDEAVQSQIPRSSKAPIGVVRTKA
jgi:DNA-binding SARP family transcriptional activator